MSEPLHAEDAEHVPPRLEHVGKTQQTWLVEQPDAMTVLPLTDEQTEDVMHMPPRLEQVGEIQQTWLDEQPDPVTVLPLMDEHAEDVRQIPPWLEQVGGTQQFGAPPEHPDAVTTEPTVQYKTHRPPKLEHVGGMQHLSVPLHSTDADVFTVPPLAEHADVLLHVPPRFVHGVDVCADTEAAAKHMTATVMPSIKARR